MLTLNFKEIIIVSGKHRRGKETNVIKSLCECKGNEEEEEKCEKTVESSES